MLTRFVFRKPSGIGIKPVSREGSERLSAPRSTMRSKHKRKSVTLVHKGNIMKFTEGAFRDWGYELASASSRRASRSTAALVQVPEAPAAS